MGQPSFALVCAAMLKDEAARKDFVTMLGGAHARELQASGAWEGNEYWLRVWAARGLLWAWDVAATDAIVLALDDEAWRVREMACKAIGRNGVAQALQALARLTTDDPVRRVRVAAEGAVQRLIAAGA